jgi:hypothetical protein
MVGANHDNSPVSPAVGTVSARFRVLKHWWILVWGFALVIVISCLILGSMSLFNICWLSQIFKNPMNLITGQYLTVLGMLTAVTIAIVSWIYNQGINNRQKGYSDLLDAIAGLKTMTLEMNANFKRLSVQDQDAVRELCAATPHIIETLSKLTPG